MRRALAEYEIMGVRTTIPFDRWLMDNPRFISGDLSTDFVADEWEARKKHTSHPKHTAHVELEESEKAGEIADPAQVAAVVGALLMQEQVKEEKLRRGPAFENGAETSRWRDAARREALR
jgi:acetyl/propionyl-CoA carboxylase alpha subunit